VTSAVEGSTPGLLELLKPARQPGTDPAVFTMHDDGQWPGGAMFGGQLAAQALIAAARTVRPEVRVHSVHTYFLRPGRVPGTAEFHVESLRDGGSFSTRSVSVRQGDVELARVMLSFHVDEPSERYELPMPSEAGRADDLEQATGLDELRRARGIESRDLPLDSATADGIYSSTRRSWMRYRGQLPDEPGLQEAVITFMSDVGAHFSARLPILGPAPRATTSGVMSVSIDHAVWFHAPARADEWLYYELQALTHQGSRALTRGRFYSESGHLVASVAQEVLIRMLAPKPALGAVT
jgi:acyl-CoA thioesterase II